MVDVEKLKQKILDLAIRGKLVPQNPDDEPASKLIERIRLEKEELIKQGKIKRTKDESYIYQGSDNSYYEKIVQLKDILDYEQPSNYIVESTDYSDDYDVPVLTAGKSFILGYTNERHGIFPGSKVSTIIFDDFTTSTHFVDFDFKVKSSAMKLLKTKTSDINLKYVLYLIQSLNYVPTTHKRHYISIFEPMRFVIPCKWYQDLVVDLLDIVFYNLNDIANIIEKISTLIPLIKYKILDSFFGENSRYKSYYENTVLLGDILKYKQPAKYIVHSTEYSDDFKTPVLTPGKTFILGYTNEKDGIDKVNGKKVIIFDDFTTASRLVDFDFKVKSSALKILYVENENLYDIEYVYYLLQTIKVNNTTHKRYWISDFAHQNVKIHSLTDQKSIVKKLITTFEFLNIMSNSI